MAKKTKLLLVKIIFTCFFVFILLTGCDNNDSPTSESVKLPFTPSGLELMALESRSVKLKWTDNANNEDYYLVERAITDADISYQEIAELGVNSTEYVDIDLVPGVEYSYRVRAENTDGSSEYCEPASIIVTGYVDQPVLRINDGDLGTSSEIVTLTILAHNISQMKISNYENLFAAQWEEFRPIVEWNLNYMNGIHVPYFELNDKRTVYLRLINIDGDTSEVIEDTIYPFPSEFELLINGGEEYVSSRVVYLDIIGAVGADRMRVSNETDIPDTSAVWWSFENETTWWLEHGDDVKTVRVDILNEFGLISSDSASVTPLYPTVEAIINNGDRFTDSRFVEITLVTENDPYEMEITNVALDGVFGKKNSVIGRRKHLSTGTDNRIQSESPQIITDRNISGSDENEEWQPFEETFTWELMEGEGTKNIQVRVRNDFWLEASATAHIEPISPRNPTIDVSYVDYVNTPEVDLNLSCENVDSMKIWNTGYEHDEWLPYSTFLGGWELIPLPGGDEDEWLETEIKVLYRNSFNLFSETVSVVVPAKENIPDNLEITSQYYGSGNYSVSAYVRDIVSEPVPDQSWVYFLLSDYPDNWENVRINDSDGTEPGNPYGAPFDSAMTNSGIAMVSVNIGDNFGPTELLVWAYQHPELRGTPEADSVLATYTGISQPVAGAPYSIHISVDERGEDGGGSIWLLEVAALVLDRFNHPVQDSIVVAFEVSDDIATIGGEGAPYTGNLNRDGSSIPGVANTILAYNSSATNDSIDIYATVLSHGGELVYGELLDFNLPLQGGGAVLYADPANWDFEWGNPALNHITIYVYDDHNHCINDQLVRFLCSKGQYYSQAGPAPINEKITGPSNLGPPDQDDCGWANNYLRTTFDEAFPDPNILESTLEVGAEIVGCPHIVVEPLIIPIRQ